MNTAIQFDVRPNYDYANVLVSREWESGINSQFEIHSLEWMDANRPICDEKPTRLNKFEVLWIKKGNGLLLVDDIQKGITDNAIFYIAPGHLRKCLLENGAEGYYISFTPEFIHHSEGYSGSTTWVEHYENLFNIHSIIIDKKAQYELEVIVKKMDWEYSNYFTRRQELLRGLLNIFMIYFSRNLTPGCVDTLCNRKTELVSKFMSLIKKNFLTEKMVSEYANLLCVTPSYLNRVVKRITNFPARHHIQQQIVLEAKRQAMYYNTSMKEIAYSLGFDNLAHFSKFFKNNCGVNFTEFKKGVWKTD